MNGTVDEQRLVKLYAEVTGASESCARSVFMFVCPEDRNSAEPPLELALRSVPFEEAPAAVPTAPDRAVPAAAGKILARGGIASA